MKMIVVLAGLALSGPAVAQSAEARSAVTADGVLLNITAEGRSERRPDLASFNVGVVTQARTAAEAMASNAVRMDATIAALRRSGVADRDLQTAALQLQPQYYYPQRERPVRQSDGSVIQQPAEPEAPRVIGYEARNSLTVRVRKVAELGRIADTLVSAGANQIEGPYFTLENTDAAADEARAQALRIARQRADLYAREAGFRGARLLTLTEGGGYYPISRQVIVTGQSAGMMSPAPPPPPPAPVQPGEVVLGVSLSAQFVLER